MKKSENCISFITWIWCGPWSQMRKTYQFNVNRQVPILVVSVLHLFVGHKLQSAMRDPEHAGNKALENEKKKLHTSLWKGFNKKNRWESIKNRPAVRNYNFFKISKIVSLLRFVVMKANCFSALNLRPKRKNKTRLLLNQPHPFKILFDCLLLWS